MTHTQSISLLDHGHVRLIEHWGSDEMIIEAARISTAKGFLGWGPNPCPDCVGQEHEVGCPGSICSCRAMRPCDKCKSTGTLTGDEKLLTYLYRNRHMTPFEMAGATIEVQAPIFVFTIFVFREWHRHRTQSYNERSARYTPLPALDCVPSIERILLNNSSTKNKQAASIADSAILDEESAEFFQKRLREAYGSAQWTYEDALKNGVPKELARLCLPVARYSIMHASTKLRNWMEFLTLRQAPNAQWEIRQYADAVATILTTCFPRTMALHKEGR